MGRDIVHLLCSLGCGGIETWLMNVLRAGTSVRDRSSIILIGKEPRGVHYAEEVRDMGIPTIEVPFSRSALPFVIRLAGTLRRMRPTVLHCHMNYISGWGCLAGALAGVPRRIAHYHVSYPENHKTWAKKSYIRATRLIEARLATDILGCSRMAIETYPKRRARAEEKVLPYGIDLEPFAVEADRASVRSTLGIPEDAFVIGHVGRFEEQKNHDFVLDIFAEIARKDAQARLLLVGDGRLREETGNKARRMGIGDQVVMTGLRRDVPRIMLGAMDLFLFPSKFEGLGLVVVEAQAAGLPCVISDVIPEEAVVTPRSVRRLSLSAAPGTWAEAALSYGGAQRLSRADSLSCVDASGLTVGRSASALKKIYDA